MAAQLPEPSGTNRSIGVTPQTLAKPVVAALGAHLEALAASSTWEHVTWRAFLLSQLAQHLGVVPPWTVRSWGEAAIFIC